MSRNAAVLAVTVVLLTLLALSAVVTQAQEDALEIYLGRNGSHEAPAGQTIVLYSGWGACSPGLVRAYIMASDYEVTLDGEILLTDEQIDQLWGPIQPVEPVEPSLYCPGGRTVYWSYWHYELESPLEPREEPYIIHKTNILDHPFLDGGDYDGDGKPDKFPAGPVYPTDNYVYIYEE